MSFQEYFEKVIRVIVLILAVVLGMGFIILLFSLGLHFSGPVGAIILSIIAFAFVVVGLMETSNKLGIY